MGYENDCLDAASGNYRTKQTYSYDSLYQLIKVDGATTYNPYRSAVPEFKSDYSQAFEFDADGLGNMTSKVSTETVSPQKSIGDNLNYQFDYVYDENYAHRLVRAGDRHYQYDANGNVTCEQDAPAPKAQSSITSSNANDGQSPAYGSFEDNGGDVAYHKITKEAEDVYSTDYGWGLFKEEDGDGNHGASAARYRRTYAWDEKNRLVSSVDANYSTAYIYGHDGQRSNKYTQSSETLYFNKMWTLHTDSGNNVYGGQTAKNIYLGETRIVTKLNSGSNPTYQEEYYKQYYYHSDHLGSASLISDYKGDEYQRIEYTPYGETWVEKTSNTGLEFLPYKFTAKELDKETGLYYYGARYLDPKYSRWISTDPALGEYIPQAPTDEEAKRHNQNLPGMGGVFNTVNASLYHYAGNNPVKYTDPDGMEVVLEGTENERNDILNMINRYSKYNYKIDETGHLFRNGYKENYGAYKSEYYSKCLDIGIESEKIINISLNTKHINKDGIVIYSDIDSQSGGGATTSYLDGSPIINVTVSPNIRELHVQANAGEYKLRREYPAEILIHELVGHAIPIAESWNGNAISKENVVREQAKLPLRKPEVNHKCYN